MDPPSSQGSIASSINDDADPGGGFPIVVQNGAQRVYHCPSCMEKLLRKRLCKGTERPENEGRTFTLCFNKACASQRPGGKKFFWFFDLVAPGVEWIPSPRVPVHPSLSLPHVFAFQPPANAPNFPPPSRAPAGLAIAPTPSVPSLLTTHSVAPGEECRYPGCKSTKIRKKPKPCGRIMCTKHCRLKGGCSEHPSSAPTTSAPPMVISTAPPVVGDQPLYPVDQEGDPGPSQGPASAVDLTSFARPLCNDWQREMARAASESRREGATKKQRLMDAMLVNVTIVLFLNDNQAGERMATNIEDEIYPFLRLGNIPVLVNMLKARNFDVGQSVIKLYNIKNLHWEHVDFATFVVNLKATCRNNVLILALPTVSSFGKDLHTLITDTTQGNTAYSSQKITPAKPFPIVRHARESPPPSPTPSPLSSPTRSSLKPKPSHDVLPKWPNETPLAVIVESFTSLARSQPGNPRSKIEERGPATFGPSWRKSTHYDLRTLWENTPQDHRDRALQGPGGILWGQFIEGEKSAGRKLTIKRPRS